MALPQVGLEAVIANLDKFERGADSITSAYDEIDAKGARLQGSSANLSSQFTSLGGSVLSLGAKAAGAVAGVAALGAAIAGAFAVGGIQKAAELDQQVADIAATMGKAKDEAQPLKDLIFDLSLNPNLTVDTNQAAEAIELLARNGLSMSEIIDGAAESTVALANATGAEFGTAADVATDVMALFNIEASEMGSAIDAITGVTTNSKFTIDDFALGLANAGGVAAGMGVDLEDLATVLAGTSASFSSGADAGTAFKTLLQRLANPTDELQATMEQYGLSLFDAEGNMRSMADVAGQLNEVFQGQVEITSEVGGRTAEQQKELDRLGKIYDRTLTSIKDYQTGVKGANLTDEKRNEKLAELQSALEATEAQMAPLTAIQGQLVTTTKELTEAEKAELAAKIGGADGSRVVLALAQMSQEEFSALSDKVNDSGSAFRAAATRVDSFKGAMEIFQGVVEAVQIQVGDKFLPILRELTVGFTDIASRAGPVVVDIFGRIAGVIENLIARGRELFGAFQAGGVGGLADALGLTPATTELIDKITGSISEIASTITGFFAPALDSLTAGGALDALNTAIEIVNEHFEELKGALAGVAAVLAGAAIASIIAAIGAAIAALATPITAIIAAAALLGAAWAGNWFGIRDTIMEAWGIVQPILALFPAIFQEEILPALQESFGIIKEIFGDLFETVAEVFGDGSGPAIDWREVLETAVKAVAVAVVVLAKTIEKTLKAIEKFWDKHGEKVLKIVEIFLKILLKDWEGAWEEIQKILENVWEEILEIVEETTRAIERVINSSMDKIEQIIKSAWNAIKNFIDSILDTIKNIIQSAWDAIENLIDSAMSAIENIIESGWKAIESVIDSAMTAIENVIESGWKAIESAIKSAMNAIKNIISSGWNSIQSAISSAMNAIQSAISSAWNTVVSIIQNAINQIISIVQSGMSQLPTIISNMASQMQSAAQAMMQGVINGINAMLAAIQAALTTVITTAINALIALITGGGSLAQQLLDAGKSIIQAIIDGIKSVTGMATELITKVKNAAISLLSSISSGSLFNTILSTGKSIIQGLIAGIKSSASDVFDTLWNIIEDAINNILGSLGASSPSKIFAGIGQDMMAGLLQGIQSFGPTISAQLQAVVAPPPVAAPVLGAGTTTINNTFNNNFGGNTIGSNVDIATFDQMVSDSIRRQFG